MTTNEVILEKVSDFLNNDATPLYQRLVKFADEVPEEVLATSQPRESSADMGEFSTDLMEYHLAYQRLIEEQIERFLEKEGYSKDAFLVALREGETESVQGLLGMVESLSDIDIFCAMIDDVKNGRF